MKIFSLPNLSSHSAVELATLPPCISPRPALKDKTAYRVWCTAGTTAHCFYSAVEGVNPGLRVTGEANPPKLLHGFVADFDATITDAMLLAIPSLGGHLPVVSTRTFSGGARLIWDFEEPVLVDCKPLAERFMKILARELKLKKLLPGLDDESLDLNQYWEAGTDWQPVVQGTAIPADILGLWLFEAAGQKGLKLQGAEIPIEEVAAEVARQYPGRWVGNFTVGARGPLFWVPDGVQRVGAQVGDMGMLCYSSRSEAAFMPWEAILGREFVRKWEAAQISSFASSLWFDGKTYWWCVDGEWVGRSKDDSMMHLRNLGVSCKVGSKDTISRAEKVLCVVQESRRVDMAAPLLFEAQEVVELNGERVLNIGRKVAMAEAEGNGVNDPENFPWLWDFLNNIFDPIDAGGATQLDFFLAWFQRLWMSARDNNLAQGQMLAVAGSAGQGKTFLSMRVIGAALGGSVDASALLQDRTNFNKQAAETCIWRIDDGAGAGSAVEAARFGDALKGHVANPIATYHPKYRDSVDLPHKGRIVLTCNTDPDSLAIIPPLDNTFSDKILMLRFHATWQPHFRANHEHEAMVANELPFFLAWLKQWVPPAAVLDSGRNRFGVKAYHHPDMVRAAQESSASDALIEVLELWREGERGAMPESETILRLSTSELLVKLQVNIPGRLVANYNVVKLGRELRKLGSRYKPLVKIGATMGIQKYYFDVRMELLS